MNFADSEVVASILKEDGYELTDDSKSANLVLLNTCSIRDKAEQTVRNKLKTYICLLHILIRINKAVRVTG